ncbi:CDP-alcohol phosphatidyltransferase family protein [Planctomycetaceae bacterium SH139]
MSQRISYSLLDPLIGPVLKSLYPRLHIPAWFPPEGIVLIGHGFAIVGAIGFAFSLSSPWGGILAAIGVLGNHTADCVDGTHARATGQCRHGGELLDHFTDPMSFAYWLVGISVALETLGWGLAALIILFGHAVLTNIKSKLTGRFVLSRFGPTEFKTLLFISGLVLATIGLMDLKIIPVLLAAGGFFALIVFGGIHLVVDLVRSVREVNRSGKPIDTSEWINAKDESRVA